MTEGLAFIAFYVALILSLSVILRNFVVRNPTQSEQKLQEHFLH